MERLTADQKKLVFARIKELDPKGEIVALSPDATFTKGTLTYNKTSGITFGETITRLTDEEYVRAYLVARLSVQLRYPPNSIEVEHTYTIGRPSATKAQIDVRVLDRREQKIKTFMLIEAKRPDDFDSYTKLIEDQLFAPGRDEHSRNIRYVVWYTIEFRDNEIYDKCIVIDFRKFTEFKDWVEEGEPGHNLELPIEYGTVRKIRYVKGSKTDLRTDVTRKELTQLQKNFHNVLWGGAKMGDTDVFNNLLKMFLAKIYDEHTTEDGQSYRFQSELKDGEPETAEELTAKVNRIYKDALKHYFAYSEDKLATAIINENRFPPNKVAYVMEQLESISITQNKFEDDVLGAFFEAIVRTGFKQEKGQFFTHANIVRFMLYALELDEYPIELINSVSPTLPYIMDSSCGSGTFLIEAMKVITDSVLVKNKSRVKKSNYAQAFVQTHFLPTAENKNVHNTWARTYIYGIEDGEDLAMATKVNMILHGDGNANIMKADGLLAFDKYTRPLCQTSRLDLNAPYKYPANEQFDVIISNPPFSLKEESRTLAEYGMRFAYADRKNSENLFVERWYQFLKPGGRMGVVLPDSVFDTNENLYIRMFLYRFFWIKAVVSLPQVTFQPYTPTKTSLLFAVKKSRKEIEVWDDAWRKASNEYSKLRKSEVVRFILTNDRLRNSLIDLANKTEVEWYPSANLLSTQSLPTAIREQIIAASQQSNSLKKRVAERLEELDEFLIVNTLEGFDDTQRAESVRVLARLLRDKLPRDSDTLTLPQLIETSYDDIVEAAMLNYTEDPQGQPYCNAWWCFAEVTTRPQFDYEIFFAEAEHVGYKRTTRHPDGIPQPNDLFQSDENGTINIDTESPKTILDSLRSKQIFFLDDPAVRRFKFSSIANHFTLRGDAKYRLFWGLNGDLLYPQSNVPCYPLKHGLVPFRSRKLKKGELDTEYELVELEDVEKRTGVIISSTKVTEINSDKLIFGGADVLTTRLRPNLGKTIYNDLTKPLAGTTEWIPFKLNRKLLHPILLKYYLLSSRYVDNAERLLSGKEHPRVAESDILSLRIPFLSLKAQDALASKIIKIENNMSLSRASLRLPQDIINEILCHEFNYPLKEHKERERERYYNRQFFQMSVSFTLRNSTKFHHPDFELNDHFFEITPHDKMRMYFARPPVLGVQISPDKFDETGDKFYLTPAVIKTGRLDEEALRPITEDFFNKHVRRIGLQRDDIILGASGEGTIGKSALYESDLPSIISQFIMRIRFDTSINPQFARYFMRSVMFQSQVEREKRGMGNMTNIFPSQVERMLIVECSRDRQDAIAVIITTELQKRDASLRSIESKRKEINALIESAILSQTSN